MSRSQLAIRMGRCGSCLGRACALSVDHEPIDEVLNEVLERVASRDADTVVDVDRQVVSRRKKRLPGWVWILVVVVAGVVAIVVLRPENRPKLEVIADVRPVSAAAADRHLGALESVRERNPFLLGYALALWADLRATDASGNGAGELGPRFDRLRAALGVGPELPLEDGCVAVTTTPDQHLACSYGMRGYRVRRDIETEGVDLRSVLRSPWALPLLRWASGQGKDVQIVTERVVGGLPPDGEEAGLWNTLIVELIEL